MYSLSHEKENFDDFLIPELLFIEKSMILAVNESPRLNNHEKRKSMKESSSAYPRSEFSPPKLGAKTKFISASLPNSATSSARFSSKKKCKKQGLASPLAFDPTPHQHSVALSRLAELRERHLKRSKSCGERRAASLSEDFDMRSPNKVNYHEVLDQPYKEKIVIELDKSAYDHKKHIEPSFDDDKKVKCGVLSLFLPGLGKAKPVKPKKEMEMDIFGVEKEIQWAISRTVSLENFECGSWSSSSIILENEDKDGNSRNLFFDLPLKFIENSVNGTDSPIKASFVFEDKDFKGVSKTSLSRGQGRKSHESTRHVRFSTSSPPELNPASPTSCITPRLRKAREDFNAFLQAKSA